jgi:hypothetical protein
VRQGIADWRLPVADRFKPRHFGPSEVLKRRHHATITGQAFVFGQKETKLRDLSSLFDLQFQWMPFYNVDKRR